MALNTLAMQHRLRDAGLNDRVSDAVTKVIDYAITTEVATKTDLQEVRNELKELRKDLKEFRNELKAGINRLESRITELVNEMVGLKTELVACKVVSYRWMMGITVTTALGFAAVVVALVLR